MSLVLDSVVLEQYINFQLLGKCVWLKGRFALTNTVFFSLASQMDFGTYLLLLGLMLG